MSKNKNNTEKQNDLAAKIEKIQHKICDLMLADHTTVGEMFDLKEILSSVSATKVMVVQFQREFE